MMIEIHKMQPKTDMHNGVGDLQQFKFSNHIYIQIKSLKKPSNHRLYHIIIVKQHERSSF
jgi:hypothetical protein